LKDALSYLKTNVIKSKVVKYDDTEKADKIYNYPYPAIEEALSNAVYHRNYELRDPIEVRVLPTAIEIISYSGVDPSLKQSDFEKGVIRTRRYRNRRVGSFLKELGLTEGKGTGIPIIYNALKENGSPAPIFDTDASLRTFFVVEIPVFHPFNDKKDAATSPEGGLGEKLVEGLVEGLVERLVDSQKSIIFLIIEEPGISKKEMARQIGISSTAVDKNIATLKKKNIIRRVGSDKGGHWEIVKTAGDK